MKKTSHFIERQAKRCFSDFSIEVAKEFGTMHEQKGGEVVYNLTQAQIDCLLVEVKDWLQRKKTELLSKKRAGELKINDRRDLKRKGRKLKHLRPCFVVVAFDEAENCAKAVTVGTRFEKIKSYELIA